MKKASLILCLISLLSTLNAVEVTYSSLAEEGIKKIIDEQFESNSEEAEAEDKSLVTLKNSVTFSELKSTVEAKHSQLAGNEVLEIDQEEKSVSYFIKEELNGVDRITDRGPYKMIALDYIKKQFPAILNDNEEFKVLYVGEEHYAEQEQDEKGEIIPEVHVKSRSFTVKVGRTLNGNPVFNSYAMITIAAENNQIVGYDLKNWTSINQENTQDVQEISAQSLKTIIGSRLSEISQDENITSINVANVLGGWILNDDSRAEPAFIHYELLELVNTENQEVTEKCSFLEMIE